jgi:hypothetical protein
MSPRTAIDRRRFRAGFDVADLCTTAHAVPGCAACRESTAGLCPGAFDSAGAYQNASPAVFSTLAAALAPD